ncbi:MAG: DUF4404 family protein [Pirellulaceae bacterium]
MKRVIDDKGETVMEKSEVLVRLRQLHEELSAINEDLRSSEEVDETTIDALGQLVSDVSDMLDNANTTLANDSGAATDKNSEIMDRVLTFETQHPRITKFLSEVTDLLGMMGI